MGKTPYESRFGEPLKGPIIPCGAMVEYHPISTRDHSRLHQFGKKVLPGTFLRYALIAGGIWKGDTLIADIEELEKMDASEIYPRKINAKEVLKSQQEKDPYSRQMVHQNVRERLRIPRTLRRKQTAGSEDLSRGRQGAPEDPPPTGDAEARLPVDTT